MAEGFDDIRQQLVNNRIDNEALQTRLGTGISNRSTEIVDQMFPELERRLDALEAAVADPRRGPECPQLAHLAQKQADDTPPGHADGSQPDGRDVKLQPSGGEASQPLSSSKSR